MFPALFLFLFEFSRDCWDGLSLQERFMASLFQSVTTRTAGFQPAWIIRISFREAAQLLRGHTHDYRRFPGLYGPAESKPRRLHWHFFVCVLRSRTRKACQDGCKRRIPYDILRNAIAILALYISLMLTATFLITWLDDVNLMEAAFETSSAVATVGLSLGITGDLSTFSKIILILLMYFGRVGGLTMLYALTNRKKLPVLLPQERIAARLIIMISGGYINENCINHRVLAVSAPQWQ